MVSFIEEDGKALPGNSAVAGSKLRHDPAKTVSNLHELGLI